MQKQNMLEFLDDEIARNAPWEYEALDNEAPFSEVSIIQRYYYHPIQISQILSILLCIENSVRDIFKVKDFYHHYWENFL